MKQSGLGLTETLIALFLSSLIMLSLAQLYLGCKKNFLIKEEQLAQVFDVQWISALLRESIRQAGFTPCLNLDNLKRNRNKIPEALHIEHSSISQSITVRRMNTPFNQIQKFLSPTQLIVSNHVRIRNKEPLIIADCYHAELNIPEAIKQMDKNQLITLQKPLTYDYFGASYIGEWIDEKWFVQTNSAQQKAFFYHQRRSEELSPLIYNMHLEEHMESKGRWIKVALSLVKGGVHEIIIGARNA